MKYKRAIGIIILLFLSSLIFSVTLSLVFNIDLAVTEPSEIPLPVWLVVNALVVSFCAIGTFVYFLSSKTEPSFVNGFRFGFLIIVIGLIGDVLAFIPYEGGLEIFRNYFIEPFFWSALVLILITSSIVGYFQSKSL